MRIIIVVKTNIKLLFDIGAEETKAKRPSYCVSKLTQLVCE